MKISYDWCKMSGQKLHQSDEVFIKDSVFAVADGMGDKNTGKLAAKLAMKLLDCFDDIELAFKEINKEIINRLSKHSDNLICGTTLSVLKLDLEGKKFYIYHVGDSKIFLFRNKSLIQLTKDQVKINSNKKYVRALGINWTFELYKNEDSIESNDIFFLTTDGICENKEILYNMDLDLKTPSEIKDYIVQNSNSVSDNISFIVVKIES